MLEEQVAVQIAIFLISLIVALFGVWKFRTSYNQRTNEIEKQTKQFEHQTKVESAKLILDIESRFLEEDNKEISKRMDAHLSKNKSFDVGIDVDDQNRRDLYNYLSELEVVCQYHKDGVLTTAQVYELLGSGIIDVMRIDPIVDLIDKERMKPHQADLYDNLQETFGIMLDYQNNKFKKSKPENLREYVNKKFNNQKI